MRQSAVIAVAVALSVSSMVSCVSGFGTPEHFDNSREIPGEYLVRPLDQLMTPLSGDLTPVGAGWYLLRSPLSEESVEAMPGFAQVEPNRVWTIGPSVVGDSVGRTVTGTLTGPEFSPNDPLLSQQWHHTAIGSRRAWDIQQTASSARVCIVDTGRPTHVDLAVERWADLTGGNGADGHGHGTHVAGIAAAVGGNAIGGVGTAASAKIATCKALSDSGSGSTSAIASCISWCVQIGSSSINLSLGGPTQSAVMSDALKAAVRAGSYPVCAAGNEGSASPSYPGADESCIGVAATDSVNAPASFTNYGPSVDVSAPGVSILSTCIGGGYCTYSGTSMASPVVAGVVAAIRIMRPDLSFAQVLQVLRATGTVLTGTRIAHAPLVQYGAALVSLQASPAPTGTPGPVPTAVASPTPTAAAGTTPAPFCAKIVYASLYGYYQVQPVTCGVRAVP